MRAELRELSSVELDDQDVLLRDYAPADPGYVGLQVDAFIGTPGDPGADVFYFIVRTPRYLADELRDGRYRYGRDYIILGTYSYALLWQAIDSLCQQIEGPDWATVARRIGRYGLWEYDDYYGPP